MTTEEQKVIQEQELLMNQAKQLTAQTPINRFLSFIIWCASAVTGIFFLFLVPESLIKNLIISVVWMVTLIQSVILLSTLRLLKIGLIKEKALSALVQFSLKKMKECQAEVITIRLSAEKDKEERIQQ